MTSFDTLESGLETSRPVEVYKFSLGSEEFLYTPGTADFTVGLETFESIAIKRNDISRGQSERKRVLTIDLPITNEFARKYIGVPPGVRASVVVSRCQRDETPSITKKAIWHGYVTSAVFPSASTIQLQCQSTEAVVGRHVPRYSFMGLCNHVHGSDACGVNLASFTYSDGTVTAVDGNVITVSGAGASGFNFRGGFVRPTGVSDPRLVLKQSGDDLTLLLPFHAEILNASVDCVAGCDHNWNGDCALTYDNVIRYGGFPFVPSRNIFTQGVL